MTEKQKAFCEEYLIDLCATQAAIRAGYAPKAAGAQASRLLKNVKVRAYIDKALAERSKRTGVTADRVVRELARLAFVNPPDAIDIDDAAVRDSATVDDTAAIQAVKCKTTTYSTDKETRETVEREVRLHDKIRALELLGKHLGMYDKDTSSHGDDNSTGVVILPSPMPKPEPPPEAVDDLGAEDNG